jgi:hypothetical protein
MLLKIVLITAKTMAKSTVTQKLLIEKVLIIASTNIIINTVMIKDIKPKVRMLMGNVKIRKIPPIKVLTKEIKNPANKAFQNPPI